MGKAQVNAYEMRRETGFGSAVAPGLKMSNSRINAGYRPKRRNNIMAKSEKEALMILHRGLVMRGRQKVGIMQS